MSFSEAVGSLHFSELLQPWVEPRMSQEGKKQRRSHASSISLEAVVLCH